MRATAVAALDRILHGRDILYVTPQNIVEFWAVCTRPIDRNGLGLAPEEAERQTLQLESFLTILPETAVIYPEWRRLVVKYAVAGVQVHDAKLVAAMNVYGIKHVLTFNRDDFERFTEVQVVD